MKSLVCASLFALSLFCFISPRQAAAQSADGSLRFELDDGFNKSLDFTSVLNRDGSTTGRMLFSGPHDFPDQDVDGTGKGGFSGKIADLQIDVNFDGMVIDNKNRAVMSGTVRGSTLSDYVGQRVLLVVEDNGAGIDDKAAPDKFTWGLYKPADESWIPADSEVKDDRGWSMTWHATDAERRDDVGYDITRNWILDTRTYPPSSYDFVQPRTGTGDIKVLP